MLPLCSGEFGVVFEPEIRFSAAGKPWMTLRVVAKDRKRDAQGQWSDGDATFLDVVCFGKIAENVAESVTKGDSIVVSGRLSVREYEKDGQKRTATQIVADHVGVALTWNPARTMRAERSTTTAAPVDDAWGTSAPAQVDEPPF